MRYTPNSLQISGTWWRFAQSAAKAISDFRRSDLELAGGKGANLGELIRTGFGVPPGYVVTTAAYDLLVQKNGLQTRLQEILGFLDSDPPGVAAKVSEQIQNLWQEISIPEPISNEIRKAHRELNGSAVAVRSSATAEDLPEVAFAGQQETFLKVIGEQAVLDAVCA